MNQRDEWLTTLPYGSDLTSTTSRRLAVRFTGSGSEYFRIWIRDMVLTLLTLTLYWPFARARRLAYFRRHTRVGNDALVFHGDPWQMLVAYLFLLGLLGWLLLLGRWGPAFAWLPLVVLVLLAPLLWRAALRFRLHNTSWRGLRLGFRGSLAGAYAAMLPVTVPPVLLAWLLTAQPAHALLAPAPAGKEPWLLGALLWVLLLPWLLARLKRYQHSGYALADQRARASFSTKAFYGLCLRVLAGLWGMGLLWVVPAVFLNQGPSSPVPLVIVGLLAMGIAHVLLVPWTSARLQNLLWNHTGTRHLRFHSGLRAARLVKLQAMHLVLIVLSAGLYWPVAQVRWARERLQAMTVYVDTDSGLDLSRSRAVRSGAVGDASASLVDIDVGL